MDMFQSKLANPDIQYWPEVRWWLAEGFHTDETLKKDIQQVYEAGFGATEFLAMGEAGADSSRYGWGSEEWVHDSQLIIAETTARGMGASMTSGTNWSNANLITIVPDDRAAAKELDFTAVTVSAGATFSGALEKAKIRKKNVHVQELIAVVAAKRVSQDGGAVWLCPDCLTVLTGQVADMNGDKVLTWAAPEDGDYELIAFWLHGTGQTASPSISVSYTVNYIDRYGIDALIAYWNEEVLTPGLRSDINRNGRVQMYMDSLELSTYGRGGQFWGYHLLDEFRSRRGYDLTPYLPFVVKEEKGFFSFGKYKYYYEAQNADLLERIRNDLYQTMTELYIVNMLEPMQAWLHSVGMTLRAEISYGMPFEISIPGKYVDGIETESLEFASQIDSYRNLAGPAHLFNRLYSSETGATLMNFMMGLDFYTQIIFTQFAAGVSRTVLHGYSSIAGADESTQWPGHEGMLPIFSERFGSRQPAFRHYNAWTTMVARYQMILRQGKPRIDLGILRLDYQFNNLVMGMGMIAGMKEKTFYETGLLRNNEGIYWKDMTLQNNGYTYDYFAPQLLEDCEVAFRDGVVSPDGPGYQALILYQEALPLSSAKVILAWARQGLPVVLVNGVTENLRIGVDKTHAKAAAKTPFHDKADDQLAEVIAALKVLPNVAEVDDQAKTMDALLALGVQPRARFTQANRNILTFLREDGDVKYLFAYNYMYPVKEAFTVKVAVDGVGKPYQINCWTGEVTELGIYEHIDGRTVVEITLQAGEATVIAIDVSKADALHAVYSDACEVLLEKGKLVIRATQSGAYTTKLTDGSTVTTELTVPDAIDLPIWDLTVEDWTMGEKVVILEDRGLGYATKEVYYETNKTPIAVGPTALLPWKDIQAVGPAVSGVGTYTTTVTIPDGWTGNNGVYLRLTTTNDCSFAVFVNGRPVPGADFDRLAVDLGGNLVSGENTIQVEVSSTLNNRLEDMGYYRNMKMIGPEPDMDMGAPEGEMPLFPKITTTVKDYGMTGKVTLVPYVKAVI